MLESTFVGTSAHARPFYGQGIGAEENI